MLKESRNIRGKVGKTKWQQNGKTAKQQNGKPANAGETAAKRQNGQNSKVRMSNEVIIQ